MSAAVATALALCCAVQCSAVQFINTTRHTTTHHTSPEANNSISSCSALLLIPSLHTTGPSIADFILVPRLQWLASGANDGISVTILGAFPHLKAVIVKLMALPAVVAFYENLKK